VIKHQTGHRSNAIYSYRSLDNEKLKDVSDVLANSARIKRQKLDNVGGNDAGNEAGNEPQHLELQTDAKEATSKTNKSIIINVHGGTCHIQL
jgi:hypothetical protein